MLTIRLSNKTESDIESIARRDGVTKSEWVRQLIDKALESRRKTPYELALECGVIACQEGLPTDASERVSDMVKERLRANHPG